MSYAPQDPQSVRPLQPTRPTSATVFGILNCIFAVLGGCGVLITAASFFAPVNRNEANPVLRVMQENKTYRTCTQVTTVLGIPGLALELASGIGLLMLKPWGRTLAIGYGVYGIFLAVLNGAITLFVLAPALLRALDQVQGRERPAAMGGAIGGIIGGGIGVVIAIVYCGLLIYFMTRPDVKHAYSESTAADFDAYS